MSTQLERRFKTAIQGVSILIVFAASFHTEQYFIHPRLSETCVDELKTDE